jgi:hypothetical protein
VGLDEERPGQAILLLVINGGIPSYFVDQVSVKDHGTADDGHDGLVDIFDVVHVASRITG